jgi:hypothetical protein
MYDRREVFWFKPSYNVSVRRKRSELVTSAGKLSTERLGSRLNPSPYAPHVRQKTVIS